MKFIEKERDCASERGTERASETAKYNQESTSFFFIIYFIFHWHRRFCLQFISLVILLSLPVSLCSSSHSFFTFSVGIWFNSKSNRMDSNRFDGIYEFKTIRFIRNDDENFI